MATEFSELFLQVAVETPSGTNYCYKTCLNITSLFSSYFINLMGDRREAQTLSPLTTAI